MCRFLIVAAVLVASLFASAPAQATDFYGGLGVRGAAIRAAQFNRALAFNHAAALRQAQFNRALQLQAIRRQQFQRQLFLNQNLGGGFYGSPLRVRGLGAGCGF